MDKEGPAPVLSPAGWSCRTAGAGLGLCSALQDVGSAACKSGKPEQNASLRRTCMWGQQGKTQRGSCKRPGEPEELSSGPMNHKMDFKISVTQRE